HIVHQQFQQMIDEAAAAGEATKIEQLSSDIPDDQNAAVIWNQAMLAVNPKVETPGQSNLTYHSYPPWSDEWHQMLERGVRGNSKAIALTRQARAKTQVDWKLAITSPLSGVLLPNLNYARNLANVLADSALHAHLHGDDFEAIERLRDLHRLGQDIGRPFYISYLVGTGIKARTASRLMMMAPDWAIENSIVPADQSNHRRATRGQIETVIHELIADDENVKPFQQAWGTERLMAINSATFSVSQASLLAPVFERDAIGRSADLSEAIRTAAQPSWPIMQRMSAGGQGRNASLSPAWVMPLGGPLPPGQAAPRFSRILFANVFVGNFRAIETNRRVRDEIRFAALSLAAQLYRADHGDWPPTLDALVPKYLSRIPVDPYSQSARPIGYVIVKHPLSDGRDRPLLFSVGDHGDQNVNGTTAPPEPVYDWDNTMSIQFRDLSRWSPPPTTQPEENQ
ncbi:MAG TPA: hypothetical protein VHS31_01215, partial [Tepidisphaeraceae bacterium]|nr:hypothetical protein [Tepidisphaeraceae bacterium]